MFRSLRALLAQSRRIGDVERRVDQLEAIASRRASDVEQLVADLDWLNGEFKKLKGRVTGSLRKDRQEQPTEAQPDGRPTAEQLNALIRAGRRPI